MNDCIQKAVALEAIKALSVDLDAETVQRAIEAVNAIPAVEVIPGRWIPVDEGLPENGKDVLVFSRGCVYVWSLVTVEDRDGNRDTVWEDEYGDWKLIKFVTHWMPIPKQPNGCD